MDLAKGLGKGRARAQGGARGPDGLAAGFAVSHPLQRMPALPYKLVLLLLLAVAGNALLTKPAHAERLCDRRVLPVPDTLSVEAAARNVSEGKLPDIKVYQACIFGTRTSVTLIRPNRDHSGSVREWWSVSCDRQQSTWFKRGGWKCSAPELRRGMDIDVPFAGKPRSVHIAFAGDVSFETAEGLTRRTFAFFEERTPLQRCTTLDAASIALREPAKSGNAPVDLSGVQRHYADFFGDEDFNTFIARQDQVFHLQPFAFDIGFAFEFPLSAAADPAHASGCWGDWFIID